ncbi:MAG: hypothetical protein K8R35_00810 [Bacteroidales bacterium]|nr:hypothetical protein [Bacteroidales bacterium]
MKKRVVRELDSLYVREADNLWTDTDRKNETSVKLTTEDWFLTVSINPVKSD